MKKLMGVAVLVLSMGGQVALAANPKGAQNIPGTQKAQSGQSIDTIQTRPQGPTDQEIDEARPQTMIREAQAPGIIQDSKNQQVLGSIKSASTNAIEITAPGTREDIRFHADPQSKVTREAKAATLADLKQGDQVRITYEMVKSERTIRSIDVIRASARIPATGNGSAINNGGAINNGLIHK